MMQAAPLPSDAMGASRALEPARRMLPVTARDRAAAALVTVAQRALPVVAESVAAGLALLAAERAVRNAVTSTVGRLAPSAAAARIDAPPPVRVFASYRETTIVERYRVRR